MPGSRGQYSTKDYHENASAIQDAGTSALVCWYYPTAVGPVSPVGIYDTNDTKRWLRIAHMGTGVVNAQWRDGGATTSASSGFAATLNDWNLLGLIFVPNATLRVFLNGTLVTTSMGGNQWPSPLNATCLGVQHISTGYDQPCPGYIGPVGRWTADIAEADLDVMYAGRDFRSVQPDSLQNYYKCDGDGDVSDLIGSFNFTETGTVGQFDAPWMYGVGAKLTRAPLRPLVNAGQVA